MREQELRLALVCYGGASLAVYMNGIAHEILKLVRASRAYQSQEGDRETFEKAAPRRPYNTDTESLYFELFRGLGKKIDLRVVVDVVSGTSAGGINGIFLARALAHDLDFDPLRNMWMELGDIEQLMEADTLADRTSKFYMYPFIWLFGDRVYDEENPDAESKQKLSRFLRSRWFKPPFSGTRMLDWMLTACTNMGKPEAGKSLLPPGHRLDLFVSLTNFFGQERQLKLHDPASIIERQHKVSLNFTYLDAEGQGTISEFGDDNIPALGFAARATSSFPGAFPPIRFMDLEEHLKKTGMKWPARHKFLHKNFPHYAGEPDRLAAMSFIDGGVTNNKPFKKALEAVYNRAAHREVDRRVIYVDPSPDDPAERLNTIPKAIPGFFRTILSSLAEIPRSEPIYGDLRGIEETNKKSRRLESVFHTVEADVHVLVDEMLTLDNSLKIETAMLASWRERAHRLAQEKAGFSYGTYLQNKVQQLLEKLAGLIVGIAQREGKTLDEDHVLTLVTSWAYSENILQAITGKSLNDMQIYIGFLRQFDVDFRVRRLRFTVKKLNSYLQRVPGGAPGAFYKVTKKQIYKSLEAFRVCWRPEFFQETVADVWPDKEKLDLDIIKSLMGTFSTKMELEDLDFVCDEFFALTLSSLLDEDLKLTVFRAYVGYPFYDILTQPMAAHADLLEVDEIRVDRISPVDCGHLHESDKAPLMGTGLFNFGAFFSRKARENDYLWGRIHASNRLVDFVLDSAGADNVPKGFNKDQFKCRLINSILDNEERYTRYSADLIERLREKFKVIKDPEVS
ncbi:patatin-like protein [Kordiimonas pumila]|uniref:Patatin-like protein n=1 Tax=Kordiimonas pumila TaxID=2161677 RepID=A0ABV7D6Y9_9PROT|nr:patatin-like protein [Kordiimonas pumila]